MHDQANGLRELFAERARVTLSMCGSDAPALTARLGHALAELGHRVVILDRSVGTVAQACGHKARWDLLHVLEGDRALDQVLLQVGNGVSVLPAARGLDYIAAQPGEWESTLARLVPTLCGAFDVWLVHGLLPGATPDASVVLALAPTADAVTRSYAHLKALSHAQGRRDFGVVVHRARDPQAAREVFDRVADTARRFLSARLTFLGYLPGTQGGTDPDERDSRTALLHLAERLVTTSPAPLLAH